MGYNVGHGTRGAPTQYMTNQNNQLTLPIPTTTAGPIPTESIAELYSRDRTVALFLDALATRQRNPRGGYTTTQHVLELIQGTAPGVNLTHREGRRVLEALEGAGVGNLREGRRGRQTRIEWLADAKNLSRVARGEAPIAEARIGEIPPTESDTLSGTLPLRDDFEMTITVPKDMSFEEAVRIGRWIQALVRERK